MAKHSVRTAASEWREVEPDFRPQRLSHLGLDCGSLIHLVGNWMSGIRLYVTRGCLEEVCMHVGSDSQEVGGLLLGRAFKVDPDGDPVVLIERSLESLEFRNSAVMLEMHTEVWDRAQEAFEDGLCVVGWYHSHPDLGAFFSATDRKTQRAFFGHPYSVGWVIDPHRVKQKAFVTRDSIEYPVPLIVLDHRLEMKKESSNVNEADSGSEATIEVKMIPNFWNVPAGVNIAYLGSARGNSK